MNGGWRSQLFLSVSSKAFSIDVYIHVKVDFKLHKNREKEKLKKAFAIPSMKSCEL